MLATTRGLDITDNDVRALKARDAHDAGPPRRRRRADSSARQRLSPRDADELAAQPGRSQPAGTRRAGPLFRATVQRRSLPRIQTRAGGVPVRVRAARGGASGLHDGRRPRLGHHRRPVRRIQRRADHPARQRDVADLRLAAADGRRDRSARFGGQPHKPRRARRLPGREQFQRTPEAPCPPQPPRRRLGTSSSTHRSDR